MQDVAFVVQQEALDVVKAAKLDANFQECKAALQRAMEPYMSLVVTEDAIADAKKDRAAIRKTAGKIDEARKMVKAIYERPLKEFTDKCKELTGICDKAVSNLDEQIKAYETMEREEKFQMLREYYETAAVGEILEYLSWDKLRNERWGNKSYSVDDAKREIGEAIRAVTQDLEAVRSIPGGRTPYLLEQYRDGKTVTEVIRINDELRKREEAERLRAEEAERKRAEDAERKKLQEAARIAQEERVRRAWAEKHGGDSEIGTDSGETGNLDGVVSGTEQEKKPEYVLANTKYRVVFAVTETQEKLLALRNYMRENGIVPEKV